MQELQTRLVTPLILLPHLGILQISPRGHPSMDLGGERLGIARNRQRLRIRLHGRRILVLGSQHRHRNRHGFSIVRIHHGRVALHGRREQTVFSGRKAGDLAAPAESEDGPRFECSGLRDDGGELGKGLRWSGFGGEEVAQALLVLVRCRRELGQINGFALEEVRDEDFVFGLVGCG